MAEPSSSSPSPSSPGNSKGKRTSTTSVKIPVSAWITLIVLGPALLVTMYGETMLLPAIPDIETLKYPTIHLLGYLQHILFQLLLWFQSVASCLICMEERK
ncbi:MAG: hypothetical protein ACJ72X_04450 [Nitrososphaeraceae archaeon]